MRKTKFILIIGFNGTGKSTLVRRFVETESKKANGRALIIAPDDQEWTDYEYNGLDGYEDFKFYGANFSVYFKGKTLPAIRQHFYNGLCVFDDCRGYFRANIENDEDLHSILIRRRQKMMDIIAVGHGFTEIPPKFFTFATDIILFNTMDNIDRRKEVLKDFETMAKAQERINKKALDNPYYYEVLKQ